MDAIIARAAATAAAMAAATAPPPPSPEKKPRVKSATDKAKIEQLKDKQLRKLVGAVVVKAASKYVKPMGKEMFKKYAEEVCSPFPPSGEFNLSLPRSVPLPSLKKKRNLPHMPRLNSTSSRTKNKAKSRSTRRSSSVRLYTR